MTSLPRATTQQCTCDLSRLYDAFCAAAMQHSTFHSGRYQGWLLSTRHNSAARAALSPDMRGPTGSGGAINTPRTPVPRLSSP